ncbi:acyltransferase family protein [Dyadobacter fanqingshengii]|uniref:Acyltransferase n=1 Tax=Dyadobacter fanqingshengii TaxID=2906443 RepID=A0A9X1T860_9BACT|nr:acyltransferase [Dyadobacter fanqingshengii]MCF0038614.1 acyltransferase [Dyadobacter fanqingshengii]USJ34553.1 acyltransferase [Dyadobacter fanqingshengii]
MTERHPHLNIIESRFLELDALRGLAAVMVVLFHYTINSNGALLGWEFRYGVTGVDIFFMISGFVIFLTISRVKQWPDFLVSRFARLYPAFWCCLFLTTIVTMFFEPELVSSQRFLANMTMMSIFFDQENMDQAYWTLLVELIFYFWILALLVVGKIKSIVSVGVAFTVLIVLFYAFSSHYPGFHELATRKIELLNHFPLFFSGILFYLIRNGSHVRRNSVLIVLSLLAACFLHSQGGRSQYHVTPVEHYAILTIFHIVFALGIFGKLGFLNKAPLLFLGKISYCLYLIHQYIGLRLLWILTDLWQINIYPALLITILTVVFIAYLVNKFVEIPANLLIRNWYKHRTQKGSHAGSREIAMQ